MTTLEIFSDPICPWCFIGKVKLDRALAARGGGAFEITWHPFQLNPGMLPEGMDRQHYLSEKFGGPDGAARVYGGIARAAEEADIDMALDAIGRTPNTVDAHRLILWAGIEHRQGAVVDALFAAYFQEGRDIGDRDVLADIADFAGLDASVIQRLLASEADTDEIRTRDAAARDIGVTAVPTFVVGGQHAVPGAQPTELWLKVIDEIAGMSKTG